MSEIKRGLPKKGERVPGSGRKKGVVNKKTKDLMAMLESHGFDAAEALVYCYKEAQQIFEFRKKRSNLAGALSALDRMETCASDLCQYVYPKKKAVEHSGKMAMTFADFMAGAELDEETEDGDE